MPDRGRLDRIRGGATRTSLESAASAAALASVGFDVLSDLMGCVIRGHRTTRALESLSNRIGHDLKLLGRHGIVVFEWGPDLDRMSMDVAVADPAVRQYLHRPYGSFVEVHGKLHRVD